MDFKLEHKKPGDLIRSEEWNKILDELIDLRKYIENMTRSVILTSLESPTGASCKLSTDALEEFNYGVDVIGLITKQYYSVNERGEICRFGITDFADIIYYWSGASNGEYDALQITLEYVDNTIFTSEKLYIHKWSELKPKGENNAYIEYLQSINNHLWYRYRFKNPIPEKKIIQYVTRVMPLEIDSSRK
jgi:hypothetical protein